MEKQRNTNTPESKTEPTKKFNWKMLLAFVIIMGIGYGVGFGVGRLIRLAEHDDQQETEQTQVVDTTTTETAE